MFIGIAATIPDLPNLPGQGGEDITVTLDYSSSNFCADANDPTLTDASPTGGVFSYTGAGTLALNTSNGAIDISNSIPGNYTVTYTVAGVGSSNFPINITAVDDATFSYSASAFCADASNQTPTITTPGGTFTTQDITFRPFQMQFDTSGGKTITIPGTVGSSFTVDWGDTTITTETGGTISHTYASGIPTSIVSIGAIGDSGAFTSFTFANSGSKSDLIDILQWGSIVWSSFYRMFWGCNNTSFNQISATDNPISNNVSTMRGMFRQATYFNSDVSGFNVDSLTDTQNMFYLTAFNNGDLGNNSSKPLSWDFTNNTTGLSNISNMFPASFNQDISSFKLGSIDLTLAFYNLSIFNNGGQSLNNWDTSGVTSFYRTLRSTAFNQNIYSWDVSSATNFTGMFRDTSAFNQNLSDWYVNGFNSSLPTMDTMFFQTTMTSAQFTDTIVGWAVAVHRDSGPYSVSAATISPNPFDNTRTQDTDNSGNTVDYSTKYGSDWPSNPAGENWTNAGDAKQFLLNNGWSVS